jgi:tRNA-uridine 2-sulfurtransferase
MLHSDKSRIMIGMSGGVDSSVSALLLLRQGHDVHGLFMKNWEEDDPNGVCPAIQDSLDAMQVCDRIGIPFDAVNFSETYWQRVFRHFLDEYSKGRTPNPDVLCNKEIKFRAFLDYAIAHGAEKIATGHYARIEEREGRYYLLKGYDQNKDQSYFLYQLDQHQLSKSIFPLGQLSKSQVRKIALEAGFDNHAKKDSTGICFIGERKFNDFLNSYLADLPGEIRTLDNVTVGTHNGLMFYTIGQRKGIGIGGRQDHTGEPWYVAAKRIEDNVLIVVQGEHHPLLYSRRVITNTPHWISAAPDTLPFRCQAKTRYRQTDQNCTITYFDESICSVIFDQPQRAVTPGQSMVFYDQDICLGGGVIDHVDTASNASTSARLVSCI